MATPIGADARVCREFRGDAWVQGVRYASLAIREHRPHRAENNSAFLGLIANNGKYTWESVEVLVELFAKDGTFVDKCRATWTDRSRPGRIVNFKVSCTNCRDPSQPLAYDRYTIAIVDASYVSPKT